MAGVVNTKQTYVHDIPAGNVAMSPAFISTGLPPVGQNVGYGICSSQ